MFFDADNAVFNVAYVFKMRLPKREVMETGNGVNCPYWALSYRKKSNGTVTDSFKTLNIKSKSLLLIPPDYKFKRKSYESEEVISIHFSIIGDIQKDLAVFYPKNYLLYEKLFDEIYRVYTNRNYGYKFRCNEYLYKILYILFNDTINSNDSCNLNIAERAALYIEKEISNSQFSVNTLADIFEISDSHLRSIFKKNFNISPKEYQISKRMMLAESMLKAKYFSVKQIAMQCGYDDEKYFSTAFKKYFGVSPKKFI